MQRVYTSFIGGRPEFIFLWNNSYLILNHISVVSYVIYLDGWNEKRWYKIEHAYC